MDAIVRVQSMKGKRYNWSKNIKPCSFFQIKVIFIQGFNPNFVRYSPGEKLQEKNFV